MEHAMDGDEVRQGHHERWPTYLERRTKRVVKNVADARARGQCHGLWCHALISRASCQTLTAGGMRLRLKLYTLSLSATDNAPLIFALKMSAKWFSVDSRTNRLSLSPATEVSSCDSRVSV